jgi:hypothetical protein
VAWLNDGTGGFTVARTGLPTWLASGGNLLDVDDDGDLDLSIGADQFGYGSAVYTWEGAGWAELPDAGVSGHAERPGEDRLTDVGWHVGGDIDDDGHMDLVVFGQQDDGTQVARVYLGDGAGSFTEVGRHDSAHVSFIGGPDQGGLGDVDCDGDLDLLIGGSLYHWDTGMFTPALTVDNAGIGQLADLDGDGYLDIVTHSTADGLQAWINDGSGDRFSASRRGLPLPTRRPNVPGTLTRALDRVYNIDLVDLDGDGAVEIVRTFKAEVSGDVSVLEVWTR